MKRYSQFFVLIVFIIQAASARASSVCDQFADLSLALPEKFSGKKMLEEKPGLHAFPDFNDPESVELFADANPFMGFVSLGERVLLVTRNPKVLEGFVKSPMRNQKALAETDMPRALHIEELPDYTAFDISKVNYLNSKIRALHNLTAWDEGPNCWNLCQIYKGWARTTFTTSAEEFSLWMDGPFSKVSRKKDLLGYEPKLGEILLLREMGPKGEKKEMHGAVALGYGLVFTKNGTGYEARYSVAPLEEMFKTYLPRWTNHIEFREVREFEDVWGEWQSKVSLQLKEAVNDWLGFESEHAKQFYPKKSGHEDIPQVDSQRLDKLKKDLQNKYAPLIEAQLKALELPELTDAQKVEKFFWEMLKARSTSAYF